MAERPSDGAVVAQPGGEEDLVGVEVADPGHELLVHEQRLQAGVVLAQHDGEALPAHHVLDRVEAEVGELVDALAQRRPVGRGRGRRAGGRRRPGAVGRRGGHEHLPEGPRVDVAQLAALGEGDHHVGVLGLGLLGALHPQQLAAHARGGRPGCRRCRGRGAGTCPGGRPTLMVRPSRRARKCLALGWRRTERPLATETALILRPTTSLARSWRRVSTSGSSGTPRPPAARSRGCSAAARRRGPPPARRPSWTMPSPVPRRSPATYTSAT